MRKYGSMKLQPGWSLDLTMVNPATNAPWDLSNRETQKEVRKMFSCSIVEIKSETRTGKNTGV